MGRRRRYRDIQKPSVPATLATRRSKESARRRHERRLAIAENNESAFREWCEDRGLTLTVSNYGEHWMVRRTLGDKPGDIQVVADWWPRTAKLVIAQRWKKGIHAHDWPQVAAVIEEQVTLPCLQPVHKASEWETLDAELREFDAAIEEGE